MKGNNLPEQFPAKDWNLVIDYEEGVEPNSFRS